MRSPILLLFVLVALASGTIYFRSEQLDEPVMKARRQIADIYQAYWDHDITKLFQLIQFGTPMGRFIEDHAEDQNYLQVQRAIYYLVPKGHGISAVVMIQDISPKANGPYYVKMSMAQSEKSPTGYVVFGWEKCVDSRCA